MPTSRRRPGSGIALKSQGLGQTAQDKSLGYFGALGGAFTQVPIGRVCGSCSATGLRRLGSKCFKGNAIQEGTRRCRRYVDHRPIVSGRGDPMIKRMLGNPKTCALWLQQYG